MMATTAPIRPTKYHERLRSARFLILAHEIAWVNFTAAGEVENLLIFGLSRHLRGQP